MKLRWRQTPIMKLRLLSQEQVLSMESLSRQLSLWDIRQCRWLNLRLIGIGVPSERVLRRTIPLLPTITRLNGRWQRQPETSLPMIRLLIKTKLPRNTYTMNPANRLRFIFKFRRLTPMLPLKVNMRLQSTSPLFLRFVWKRMPSLQTLLSWHTQ